MAREAEKSQKTSLYDSELDRIRHERLKMQQDYEKGLQQRERDYQDLMGQNMKKVNMMWQQKLEDERKKFSTMRSMKIAKLQEGEESLLLTQSFPNIIEQELKNEVQ